MQIMNSKEKCKCIIQKQHENSEIECEVRIQDSKAKCEYKIQTQNGNQEYKWKMRLPNLNAYKSKLLMENENSVCLCNLNAVRTQC
jgi:hypothetical protein